MARSPFTLAALATAAVPGLVVSSVEDASDAEVDAARLTTPSGESWSVRVPKTKAVEDRIEAELRALAALTQGVRARLPFAVPTLAGRVRTAPTSAYVASALPGRAVTPSDLESAAGLAFRIGEAIGAVHALPTTIVVDAGLAVGTAAAAHARVAAIVERASATRLLPAALERRWSGATDDGELWQFVPTVVGGLTARSFAVDGEAVAGISDWAGLGVDDPAGDLAWAMQSERVAEGVLAGHARSAGVADRRLRHRATLLRELELAKWLLHGVDTNDTAVVDDAVELLTNLADRLHGDLAARIDPPTAPVLTMSEVEELLDDVDEVQDAVVEARRAG